jgi:hypothetical protein
VDDVIDVRIIADIDVGAKDSACCFGCSTPARPRTSCWRSQAMTLIALDGNSVPPPQTIDTLFLAPAERADVIVEMSRPGVWILGGVKDEDRKMGLGVVVEYANQRGEAQWVAPPTSARDYTIFGRERPLPAPDERLDLVFEKVPGGRGGYNRWTINGKSWPRCQSALHYRAREALPPRDEQQERRQSPRPSASPYIRTHQDWRESDRGRDERYRQHDAVQHG